MSKIQVNVPRGTRDFPPEVMIKRNFLFGILKNTFEKYNYLPLETPAFEMLSVLEGKGGGENEKLMFRILNSGDFLQSLPEHARQEELFSKGHTHLSSLIAEKGLRFDLTIPFARFVAMNYPNLSFPFKRYQIQPVWRADRPQKGRYREFYQCDIDIAGSDSLFWEAEILVVIKEVFHLLKIQPVKTIINHRKILSGVVESLGKENLFHEISGVIDKLSKVGNSGMMSELVALGLSDENISTINRIFGIFGSSNEKLFTLKGLFPENQRIEEGISDLRKLLDFARQMEVEESGIEIDFSLARGLGYYTGVIFETRCGDEQNSICGGGRYDDLTGVFGLKGVSGVGVSFGAERIYDILENGNLFPGENENVIRVLIAGMDDEGESACVRCLKKLRQLNIKSTFLPGERKLKKQLAYADKNKIHYVLILGPDELKNNTFTLKNMFTGEQKSINSEEELINILNS